jgi:hypothetical protein
MLTFRPMRRAGLLLALASLLAASGCFGGADEEGPAPPTPTEVRGCRERIEGGGGGSFSPVLGRDTVAGPVTFLGAKATYRRTPPTSELTKRGVPMKVPTIVRSGAPATLSVPRSERRWLHLAYVRPTHTVKLKPVPAPSHTQGAAASVPLVSLLSLSVWFDLIRGRVLPELPPGAHAGSLRSGPGVGGREYGPDHDSTVYARRLPKLTAAVDRHTRQSVAMGQHHR